MTIADHSTSIELPQFPDAHLLTHSREQCFKTCARKHFFSYELGLRPKHTADPLRKGNGFHKGIEVIKQGHSEDEAEAFLRDLYATTQRPPWMEATDYEVECETMIAMVKGWSRRWADDMIVNYIAVEEDFDVAIVNPQTGKETPTFRSAGKLDGIAELPDQRIALVEHKTVGESIEPGSDYWGRLLMDSQISRYYKAAKQRHPDLSTTIFDVTRKPSIKPKIVAKADRTRAKIAGDYFGMPIVDECPECETPKMFGARLLADMATRPDFYFGRMEIPRLDHDLREFEAEQWTIQRNIRAAQLDHRVVGMAAWPRNTAACTTMGTCVYFDVCRGLRGDPTEQIPEGFRRVARLHEELSQDEGTVL